MNYQATKIDAVETERLTAQLEQLKIEREEKKHEIMANKLELTTIEEGIKALETQLEEG